MSRVGCYLGVGDFIYWDKEVWGRSGFGERRVGKVFGLE